MRYCNEKYVRLKFIMRRKLKLAFSPGEETRPRFIEEFRNSGRHRQRTDITLHRHARHLP